MHREANQIYLEESQHKSLSRRARAAGATTSDVIREAVDAFLAEPKDELELPLATTNVRRFPMFRGLKPAYRERR
ncbi:MAG TPA: ribbon-helix-helix protein, CopG family [Actinomycetota bacterium]|nr:ribbon-helix-helix protein, CopG family [Actinomycetota bacterium]